MKTASNFGGQVKDEKVDDLNERDENEDMNNLEDLEEINDLKNKIPKWKDVHDKDNIIVFRNFVEMILTTAQFKYNNPFLDKNLIKLFEQNIEPNACKGGKREGEHLKVIELINKEITSDYSKKLKQMFDNFAATQKASDENDRTLKLGVIMQNFLDNNLLGESLTFDSFVEIAQKTHAKSDQIFDKSINFKSSVTKTQSSSAEDDDKDNLYSDLHYEVVLKENVKDKISSKMSKLNEMLAELQKKKEAEAEALAQEQNDQEAEHTTETAEKVVDPLENIKTEKDKREWVLKELKMFETTESQRKK